MFWQCSKENLEELIVCSSSPVHRTPASSKAISAVTQYVKIHFAVLAGLTTLQAPFLLSLKDRGKENHKSRNSRLSHQYSTSKDKTKAVPQCNKIHTMIYVGNHYCSPYFCGREEWQRALPLPFRYRLGEYLWLGFTFVFTGSQPWKARWNVKLSRTRGSAPL